MAHTVISRGPALVRARTRVLASLFRWVLASCQFVAVPGVVGGGFAGGGADDDDGVSVYKLLPYSMLP